MVDVPPKLVAILQTPWPLLGAWLIGGLLTIFIPVTKWRKGRKSYYNYAGRYIEYENNQRAYEEAQNGDNNGNGNNNQRYYVCKWYQVNCRKKQYQYQWYNEEGEGNNQQLPDWYAVLGGKMGDDERREREEMGIDPDRESAAVKMVYTVMLISFIAIVAYGCFAIFRRHSMVPLVLATAMFGLSSFLQIILLTQGVIVSGGGRGMEDSVYGWYGQLAILMVYTDWAYILFTLIFLFVVGIKSILQYKLLGRENISQSASISAKQLDDEPNSYGRMA